MKLLLVESSIKAQTLWRVVQTLEADQWMVISTNGKAWDFDPKTLSVDTAKNFGFNIIVINKKVTSRILTLIKEAEKVYICTDPDDYGRFVAHTVFNKIQKHCASNVLLLKLRELTVPAVLRALKSAKPYQSSSDFNEGACTAHRITSWPLTRSFSRILCRSVDIRVKDMIALDGICNKSKLEPKYTILFPVGSSNAKYIGAPLTLANAKSCATIMMKHGLSAYPTAEPVQYFCTDSLIENATTTLQMSNIDVVLQLKQMYDRGLITYYKTKCRTILDTAVHDISKYVSRMYGDSAVSISQTCNQYDRDCLRITDVDLDILSIDHRFRDLYALIWDRTINASRPNPQSCRFIIDGLEFCYAHTHVGKIVPNKITIKEASNNTPDIDSCFVIKRLIDNNFLDQKEKPTALGLVANAVFQSAANGLSSFFSDKNIGMDELHKLSAVMRKVKSALKSNNVVSKIPCSCGGELSIKFTNDADPKAFCSLCYTDTPYKAEDLIIQTKDKSDGSLHDQETDS